MNINRNNYEEYFLLYADNELTATERKVVEIFLQENVDLKEEFLMIQMTVNSPEREMKLSDKSFLLKTEPSFINENNYEEIFVLYHDNELSEEQKRKTEKFIAENLKLQSEFESIGKAKLHFEKNLIYPNKKELYRKEKSGKIIPLVLWRSFAAAVFIGFGLWIAIPYFNKNKVYQPVASIINNAIKTPGIKERKPAENTRTAGPENEQQTAASSSKIKESKETSDEEKEIKKTVLQQKIKKESITKTEEKPKDSPIEEKIEMIKPNVDYQLATSNQPIKKLPQTIEKTENSLENNLASIQKNGVQPDVEEPHYAQRASYISPADQNNDNYVFYDISTEEFRKSKVGGFLKKVKRVVERNNPISRLFPGDEEQTTAK